MIRSLLVIAAAGLIAVGAVAGCGGEEDEQPEGEDLTTIRCPMAPPADQAEGGEEPEPPENAFDTAELIGMELDAARSTAAEHGCEVVVSLRDGKGVPVPIELDPTRIYVYTKDGAVTYIEGVGGGL